MNGRGDDDAANREPLFAVNEDAANFYRNQLLAGPHSGPRDYLVSRSFGALLGETSFTVGYAPTGWTGLVDHLARQGYSDTTLHMAGLACRTRRGTLVDRFRDRITFGIRNPEGALAGFTARCHPSAPATVPKYLNTPATAIYNKGDAPFGIGEQHASIREGAVPVLVEGPFDAVAVHMAQQDHDQSFAGIAMCGTAISGSLVRRLAQLSGDPVVLAFDGDAAGNLATERAAIALSDRFNDVRAVKLTSAGDPAEVLARTDAANLRAYLVAAQPAADRIFATRIDGWSDRLDNAEARVSCLRDAAALLGRLRPADAAHHAQHLSELLELGAETVTRELLEATSPGPFQPVTKAESPIQPISERRDRQSRIASRQGRR